MRKKINLLILPHAQRLKVFLQSRRKFKKKNKCLFFKGIKKRDNVISQDNENIFLPEREKRNVKVLFLFLKEY